MAIDGIYDTGTISVNAGATAVTGVGTAWETVGITPGDKFEAGGLIGIVESVADNTHLTLTRGWPGASNLSGAGYQIVEDSWLRSAISTAQRQIGRIVNILNGTGYIYPVAAGGTPDNSLGEDNQYALDLTNLKLWKKVGGVWTGPTILNTTVAADADYLVKTAHAGLSAERVVTDNSAAGGIVWDWVTAGVAKAKEYFSGANKFKYSTSANTSAEADITSAGRALINSTVTADGSGNVSGVARLVVGNGPSSPDAINHLIVSHNDGAIRNGDDRTIAQIAGKDGLSGRLLLDGYDAHVVLSFRYAAGTAASPTAVPSGQEIGAISAWGYGSTGYNSGPGAGRANIKMIAAETWTDSAQGTHVTIETTPVGSTTPVVSTKFDSAGRVLVNTDAAYDMLAGVLTPQMQIHATDPKASLGIGRWANSTAQANIMLGKSRGAAVGTRGVVQSGDGVGSITWVADDGTNFLAVASVRAQIDGTPGTNDMPGRLLFMTTPDGTSTVAENLCILNTGAIFHRNRNQQIVSPESHLQLRIYTVGTIPTAAVPAQLIFVSDGASNRKIATSDGANWYFPDGAIVS